MVRIMEKRSNHKNLFQHLADGLSTDEFIYRNKKAIRANNRLMDLFYLQYRPYLYKAARRVLKTYPTLELDALVNEGFEGMLRALRKYDCNFASFLTYAQYWVSMKMNTYAQKTILSISLPGSIHSALGKYKHLLQANPGISDADLSVELNITEKKLKILHQAAALHINAKGINDQSGMAPYEDLDDPDRHPTVTDQVFVRVISGDFARTLKEVLPEKECYVIISLFGLNDGSPKVLERVGKVLNVSKERVRQIKELAFDKLRNSEALREYI